MWLSLCLWCSHSLAELVGWPASILNLVSTTDSSLVKGNKWHPRSVLLSDHPDKKYCFRQKSHLALKAYITLHIGSAYSKGKQQKELNEGFWTCYMPQTSLTNVCSSLKKLYIFISFYLRCMNFFGGDRHYVAPKEQDFILIWKTQAVTPLSGIAVSLSEPTPWYKFSHTDVKHMQE